MTLLLLDTTFLIDAERDGNAFDDLIGDDDDVAVAAITVAELTAGVQLASKRHRAGRQRFLDDVVAAIPILPYDETVAATHATLLVAVRKAGRPRGAHDLIIAATAVAHRRTVVSADRAAFAGLPGVTAIDHSTGR